MKQYKVEIRITDYEENFDTVFTKNDVESKGDFKRLMLSVASLFPDRDDLLSFKDLDNKAKS